MAVSAEVLLVSAILNTKEFLPVINAGVESSMFVVAKSELKFIEKQFNKHGRVPSAIIFKRMFPDFKIQKSVDDLEFLIDDFKSEYTRQQLIDTMSETTDLVSTGDIDKAVSLVQKNITRIATRIGTIQETNILDNWEEIYNAVEDRRKRYEDIGMAGIATGFKTFDQVTGGIQAGHLITVAARLGEGKTMAMLRMAVSAMLQGYKVHYSALEMSRTEVGIRVHNMLSGEIGKQIFNSLSLAQGNGYDPAEYRQFLRDIKDVVKGSMTVSDSRGIGALEVASQLERNKPDIYFFDYLTLGKMNGDGGWKDIGNFTKELKTMAGDYKTGIVVASQLNREAARTKDLIGADMLSESDAIGQDSDGVITMRKRTRRITEYYLAKWRHGPSGATWYAHIEPSAGVFKEVSASVAEDIMDDDKDQAAEERAL